MTEWLVAYVLLRLAYHGVTFLLRRYESRLNRSFFWRVIRDHLVPQLNFIVTSGAIAFLIAPYVRDGILQLRDELWPDKFWTSFHSLELIVLISTFGLLVIGYSIIVALCFAAHRWYLFQRHRLEWWTDEQLVQSLSMLLKVPRSVHLHTPAFFFTYEEAGAFLAVSVLTLTIGSHFVIAHVYTYARRKLSARAARKKHKKEADALYVKVNVIVDEIHAELIFGRQLMWAHDKKKTRQYACLLPPGATYILNPNSVVDVTGALIRTQNIPIVEIDVGRVEFPKGAKQIGQV